MSIIRFWSKLKNRFGFVRNKYFLTSVGFILWLLFFDQNNILDNKKYVRECKQLEKDKEFYTQKNKDVKRKLIELQTGTENLEKFAREEYYMKKDNEDIFIIIRED